LQRSAPWLDQGLNLLAGDEFAWNTEHFRGLAPALLPLTGARPRLREAQCHGRTKMGQQKSSLLAGGGGMTRILVVDDDPDYIEVTSTILKAHGYQVLRAANGKRGLEVMRNEKPDLVLLDVMMSYVLDGLDVAEQMSQDEDLKHIPVLMISTLPSTRFAEMFPTDRYAALNGWLTKPIAPDELLKQVARLLDQTGRPEGSA
jgi:CheY-like chemotaxis protein